MGESSTSNHQQNNSHTRNSLYCTKAICLKEHLITTACVKAFVKNDWVWVDVVFRPQDLYKRGVHEWKECNPKLVKQGKKYFLNVSYEQQVTLHKEKIQHQRICAVDLGLTNSAVCSILDANGTVLARKFIRHRREKDQLRRATNYLRKAQRQTGYASMPRYWNRINGLQKQILNDTAAQIIQFAKQHHVHTIVFEYLDKMRLPKGVYGAKRLRFKLHYWAKKGIQNKVEEMAHYEGMRISRVNPRNTSKLAYDGSGEVNQKCYVAISLPFQTESSTTLIYPLRITLVHAISFEKYKNPFLKRNGRRCRQKFRHSRQEQNKHWLHSLLYERFSVSHKRKLFPYCLYGVFKSIDAPSKS